GQPLPPGAGGRLLRSVAYFDGAGAGGPVLVLSLWIAGALLAAGVGAAVAGRRQGQVAVSDGTTNRAEPVNHGYVRAVCRSVLRRRCWARASRYSSPTG